ncbi:MAG TPA: hypothetical protein VGI80_06175, partial [Pyrinomonadaceae bacterium]
DIDNEGMVQLPDDLRVGFYSVVAKLAKDNAVPVTIIREGKKIETALSVSNEDNRLIRALAGEKPPYFIYGPLVFSPARLDGVASYARVRPNLESMQSLLFSRILDTVEFPGEELVVVTSPFFAHKITKGYEDPLGQVVKQVNGTPVKNLRQLVELLRDCKDEYLTIRFAEEGTETLIFRRDEIEKATDEILEDNGINPTRRGSEELVKIWKQRPPG